MDDQPDYTPLELARFNAEIVVIRLKNRREVNESVSMSPLLWRESIQALEGLLAVLPADVSRETKAKQ